MQHLLDKIYDKVIFQEKEYTYLGKKFDEEVEKIIAPLYETIEKAEVEKLRAIVYDIAYLAQKDGFKLGVQMAMEFVQETKVCAECRH